MKAFHINIRGFIISAALFVIALTVACVLAFGTSKNKPDKPGEETSGENGTDSKHYTTDDFVYKTDITKYMQSLNITGQKYLVLVNKQNPIDENYDTGTLVTLDSDITLYGKEVSLEKCAADAAAALIAEMRAEGFSGIYVTSGYRSYAYQQSLFNSYVSQERSEHPTWSDEQIVNEVLSYSAYPGTSEHQSGLCMDLFVLPDMTELENFGHETAASGDLGFAETEEYEWLLQNAHKFGFILRYPEDKTNTTGYSYESWHYRFVGVDAATKIYRAGQVLEEYCIQHNAIN